VRCIYIFSFRKFNLIMPKLLPSGADERILALSSVGLSSRNIVAALKEQNIVVSQRSVLNVINNNGVTRQSMVCGKEKPKFKRLRKVRTKENIEKVKKMAEKRNPPSFKHMAMKLKTVKSTIFKIIHDDNQMVTRKKTKVHKLKDNHKQNRKTNSRKLYNNLSGDKSEYGVTIDEAYLYLSYCNGETKICFIKRGEQMPEDWVNECNETFPEGFMIVGGITGRGRLPLIRIPKNTKISADTYIEYVLKPIIESYLPKLYPNEMEKVFWHHDKASSHTASKTQQYLQDMTTKYGITFIQNKDIPVKSPDGSPMDFFGFGFLKQKLFLRRAKTLNGVWKCAKQEWDKVTLEMVKKVIDSWKRRLRLINKNNGAHIEQTKDIHKRRIKL
jgi:[histone H3]-lysine36 N-dimethyltransferase SETMAR